ncbi:MAG: hypothetical protein HUU35_14475 [Armatimonadetes bacterium]|nr:hypothetical protein [Armatimonadota bacterium]
MRSFHHMGLPTDERQPGEEYVAETKVYVTDPRAHRYKVEYLRYEPDTPVTGPVRDLPHIAYKVDDFETAMAEGKVLLGPFNPTPGLRVVFVEIDGAVVEFMEFERDSDLPWG